MARFKVKLDHAGIAEILKSQGMMRAVQSVTRSITANARMAAPMVEGIPGDVAPSITNEMTVTDRAHGRVTIAHPAGLAIQAKHGLLTRAAAEAGLEVKAGGSRLVDYTTRSGKKVRVSAAQAAAYKASRKS